MVEMEAKRIKLNTVHGSPRNVRVHTDIQLQEMAKSLRMFGQYRPLVVAADGEVIVGNGLYEAMVGLGWTEADALILSRDATDEQKVTLMLADNRLYEIGRTDMEAVEEAIRSIMDEGGSVDVPGFDQAYFDRLLAEADAAVGELNFRIGGDSVEVSDDYFDDLDTECPRCHFRFKADRP